jgi:hypothetical protein
LKRTTLALALAFFVTSSFSQADPSGADAKTARDLSRSLVYLKTLVNQCHLAQSEKDTLTLFAKISISKAYKHAQVEKAQVEAGSREGKWLAAADLKKGPKSVVCENARKTIQQIGNNLTNG